MEMWEFPDTSLSLRIDVPITVQKTIKRKVGIVSVSWEDAIGHYITENSKIRITIGDVKPLITKTMFLVNKRPTSLKIPFPFDANLKKCSVMKAPLGILDVSRKLTSYTDLAKFLCACLCYIEITTHNTGKHIYFNFVNGRGAKCNSEKTSKELVERFDKICIDNKNVLCAYDNLDRIKLKEKIPQNLFLPITKLSLADKFEEPEKIVKLLDLFIGIPFTLLGSQTLLEERRALGNLPGTYSIPKPGTVCYLSALTSWFRHPEFVGILSHQLYKALYIYYNPEKYKHVEEAVSLNSVGKALATVDKQAMKVLLDKVRKLDSLMPNYLTNNLGLSNPQTFSLLEKRVINDRESFVKAFGSKLDVFTSGKKSGLSVL